MNTKPTSQPQQPASSQPHLNPSSLLQSRELGEAGPEKTNYATTIASKPAPVAKSWAHFVAGGYFPLSCSFVPFVLHFIDLYANCIPKNRVGGMTAATLTAPLDVLKTRLQSDFYQSQLRSSRLAHGISPHAHLSAFRSSLLHFRETFQILGSVHKLEGWRALFKGLGPNLIGVVPARSINFFVVGNGKRIIADYGNNGKEEAWVVLCAAALAGVVTSTVTNPIWLIKTRLQLDKNVVEKSGGQAVRRYRNSWDCIRQVVRGEGVRGLYKGMSASYLGVTESTLQWVLYEEMKKGLKNREERIVASGRERGAWDEVVSWTGSIGAAGSAKLVAALATYPHEVLPPSLF